MIRKIVLIVGGIAVVLAIVFSGLFRSSEAPTPRPDTSVPQPTARFQSPATNVLRAIPTFAVPQMPPALPTIVFSALPTIGLPSLPTPAVVFNNPTYRPIGGSWVASAPTMSVRFFAMPWWVVQPDASSADHLALGLADGNVGFESFDIYRYRAMQGSDQSTAWQAEFQANVAFSSGTSALVTRQPQSQLAGPNRGNLGQYHYVEGGTGRQIDATLWVGQVGLDRVVMLFRGTPDRDPQIDQAVTQVLATVDFNARQ